MTKPTLLTPEELKEYKALFTGESQPRVYPMGNALLSHIEAQQEALRELTESYIALSEAVIDEHPCCINPVDNGSFPPPDCGCCLYCLADPIPDTLWVYEYGEGEA